MRVVLVAPTPFGSGGLLGGGERYPLELGRALAREVDCELVSFGPRPALRVDPSGLRIRTLRHLGHLGAHPAHPITPALPAAVWGADVVHVHHLRAAPSRYAAVIGRARRQPVVVTDHGLQGGDWHGLLPRLVHRHLAVSEYAAAVAGVPRERCRIVYGGADPERFHPDPDVPRRGVLFVGRLTPHKGVDRLIAALPDGVPLRVVGSSGHDPRPPESDYPRLLGRLAAGRPVDFAGAVPDAELPALVRSAAVLALPTVDLTCYGVPVRVPELLGLVVLEAMMSATPVVASRLGGLPEIVRDGETGFLVTPGDVAELRDRLATLSSDPALARRMGARARELAVSTFSWGQCARRCLAGYAELVDPPRRRATTNSTGESGVSGRPS